jgi:putative hemolysin
MQRSSIPLVIAGALLLASCGPGVSSGPQPQPNPPQAALQVVPPTSNYCLMQGGTPRIEYRPDGIHFDVCVFPDDRQCEDWAMSYGECPVGGVTITNYVTRAARYCAISGGQYVATSAAGSREQGSCTFRNGKVCDAQAFWTGGCSKAL